MGFRGEPADTTLGSFISCVYMDIRRDGFWRPVMEAMQDANAGELEDDAVAVGMR